MDQLPKKEEEEAKKRKEHHKSLFNPTAEEMKKQMAKIE